MDHPPCCWLFCFCGEKHFALKEDFFQVRAFLVVLKPFLDKSEKK